MGNPAAGTRDEWEHHGRTQRTIFLVDARPPSFAVSGEKDGGTWLSLALLGVADKLRQLLLSAVPLECAVCAYSEDGAVWDLLSRGDDDAAARGRPAVRNADATVLSMLEAARENASSSGFFFDHLASLPASARLARPSSTELPQDLAGAAAALEVALASLPADPGSSDAWITVALPIVRVSSDPEASRSSGGASAPSPADRRPATAPSPGTLAPTSPSQLLAPVAAALGRRAALLAMLPVDLERAGRDVIVRLLERNGRGWQDWAELEDAGGFPGQDPCVSGLQPPLDPPPPLLAIVPPAWRFALNANYAAWAAKRLARVEAALEEHRAERERAGANDAAGISQEPANDAPLSRFPATGDLLPATLASQLPPATQPDATPSSRPAGDLVHRPTAASFPPEACRWDQLQRLSDWRQVPGTHGFGRRAVSGCVPLVILPRRAAASEDERRSPRADLLGVPLEAFPSLPPPSAALIDVSSAPTLVLRVRMYPFVEASRSAFSPPSTWVDAGTGAVLETRGELADEKTGQSIEAWVRSRGFPGASGGFGEGSTGHGAPTREGDAPQVACGATIKSEHPSVGTDAGPAFWGGADAFGRFDEPQAAAISRPKLAPSSPSRTAAATEPTGEGSESLGAGVGQLTFWSVYPSRTDARTKQVAVSRSFPRVALPKGAPKGAHGDAWPGLRLLGFRRRRSLESWAGMGGVRLVFPDVEALEEGKGAEVRARGADAPRAGPAAALAEEDSPASPVGEAGAVLPPPARPALSARENAAAFFALHAAMLRTKTCALVESKRTRSSPPRMGALVAQRERRTEDGLFQLAPPCLLLVPLPYAEETRAPESDATFTGGIPPPPPSAAVGHIAALLQRFEISDLERDLALGDPQALRASEVLERAARGLDLREAIRDDTMPDEGLYRAAQGAGAAAQAGLDLFERVLTGGGRPGGKGGAPEDASASVGKRARSGAESATGTGGGRRGAASAQSEGAVLEPLPRDRLVALWRSDALATLSVAQLRAELWNLDASKTGNKAQLVDRLGGCLFERGP